MGGLHRASVDAPGPFVKHQSEGAEAGEEHLPGDLGQVSHAAQGETFEEFLCRVPHAGARCPWNRCEENPRS